MSAMRACIFAAHAGASGAKLGGVTKGSCFVGSSATPTTDPFLTMEPPGTAVRTALSPGQARPSGPKLSVLFRRSYALTFRYPLIVAEAVSIPTNDR
jgi:hypothetical protein